MPFQIHILKTSPSVAGGGAFGRWLGHKGEVLKNGIGIFTRS